MPLDAVHCSQDFSLLSQANHSCRFRTTLELPLSQAGTGPSRRHIQGSKIAKRLPSVKYSLLQYSKIENFSKKVHLKKWSEWRAKRGTLPKLSTFLSQLKGRPFGEKTNFRKKSHNAEKLKGRTLWREKNLGKKVSQCRKTEGGDPLGFSNIHSDAKQQKN